MKIILDDLRPTSTNVSYPEVQRIPFCDCKLSHSYIVKKGKLKLSLVALTAASVHIACKFVVGRKFKKRIERVAVAVYLNWEKN